MPLSVTSRLHRSVAAGFRMKWVLVYKGKGMYEEDTDILLRVMKEHVDTTLYEVDTVSEVEIIKGRLAENTALLAIGGGYDLGLIEAFGSKGMTNIKDFVKAGGGYLGICSGAYFACDRIEFDKGGSLQVLGERFLKFYAGLGIGPLFKPYDYRNRRGACAVSVDFRQPVGTSNQYPDVGDQQECSDKLKETRKDHSQGNGNHLAENHHSEAMDQETAPSFMEDGAKPGTDRSKTKESQVPVQDIKSQIHVESQAEKPDKESQQAKSQSLGHDTESRAQTCLKESQITNEINTDTIARQKELLKFQEYNEKELPMNNSTEACSEKHADIFTCNVYFNGGCYFKGSDQGSQDSVTILSRYLDLPDCPAAIIRCESGAGVAILSGVHLEYDARDIDDGDTTVTDIIPCLKVSAKHRKVMLSSMLQQLNISIK